MILARGAILTLGLLLLWQIAVLLGNFPPYILPGPTSVFSTLFQQAPLISQQAIPTIIETLLGLLFGTMLGCWAALSMSFCRPIKLWFLPVLLISQALPTFAITPLFVLWLGYGITSKVAITVVMLFFPVASAFYDGLRKTPQSYLDLAQTMGSSGWQKLWRIQVPHALPSLATGLRVAATIAPIGAVIGEWVGSSEGLGFLLLNSNARMQISLMFAVLVVITVFTLLLYFVVDKALTHIIDW